MSTSTCSTSASVPEVLVSKNDPSQHDSIEKETRTVSPVLEPIVPDQSVQIAGWKLLSIMVGITLAGFLMLLDTSILVTAIPEITNEFNSLSQIGWYGAAYQLSSAAIQPLVGKLYANFNTKWTFIVFFLLFELGSLLCGVATSSNMLIVGRAVAGMGTAGILNGAFTIIAGCVPMSKRPAFIGIVMGISQLGLVVGPLIGGALTQFTTWRWCFYINLPCMAVVGPLVFFADIPDQTPKPSPLDVLKDLHNKVDLIGFALFAPACIMLLLAVQWGGNQFAWNSSVVIGLFVGAGVNGLIWLAWGWYKKDDAMIPISMVVKRSVWSSCLNYGLLMSAMFCTSYYLPVYFQAVKNATPTLSGVYLLPSVLSQLIGTVGGGQLVGRLGYYLPFAVASAVLTSVGYGLLSTIGPHTTTGEWIGYQILFGFGRGLGLQMPLVAVQNTLPPALIPVGTALIIFSSTFGGALFLSFADTIFTNSLQTLISSNTSQIDVGAVIHAGATGFRRIVSGANLVVVLDAYSRSIDRVFYMIAALGVVCFLSSFGLGWKDVRRKAPAISKA